jgi:hypothetical protein
MLEQMWNEQTQEAVEDQDQKTRTHKRRKTATTVNSTSIPDGDDDDDYYPSMQGKKVKGGIGYAGDQKEDVGSISLISVALALIVIRLPAKWKHKLFRAPRMKKSVACSPRFVYIFRHCIVPAVDRQVTIWFIRPRWLIFEDDLIMSVALSFATIP